MLQEIDRILYFKKRYLSYSLKGTCCELKCHSVNGCQAQTFCGNSHGPREGLWEVISNKSCLEINSVFKN